MVAAHETVQIGQMVHAENGDMIEWLTDKLQEKGLTEPFYHSQARIPIAEGEATSRAIVLAELVSNPILFVHVSAAVSPPFYNLDLS